MKTIEATKKQMVQVAKAVIPQTSAKAQKLINGKETIKTEVKTVNMPVAPTSVVTTVKETKPKATKVRTESMEALAMRLRKEQATEEAILSAYIAAYKAKGILDVAFVTLRTKIYLKIADKRIAKTV